MTNTIIDVAAAEQVPAKPATPVELGGQLFAHSWMARLSRSPLA
jgi:hypothetical protein